MAEKPSTSPKVFVSNTTPLIALAELGQLDLLRRLYTEIIIPPEVFAEYQAGLAQHQREDRSLVKWIRIQPVALHLKTQHLDAGEAAAISLAIELKAELLLIDEYAGRRTAERLGCTFIGTLGILLLAKQVGLIPEIGALITTMLQQGRRYDPKLIEQVLTMADEQNSYIAWRVLYYRRINSSATDHRHASCLFG